MSSTVPYSVQVNHGKTNYNIPLGPLCVQGTELAVFYSRFFVVSCSNHRRDSWEKLRVNCNIDDYHTVCVSACDCYKESSWVELAVSGRGSQDKRTKRGGELLSRPHLHFTPHFYVTRLNSRVGMHPTHPIFNWQAPPPPHSTPNWQEHSQQEWGLPTIYFHA